MLAGRCFKLREPVIATTLETDGRRVAVMVPTSSIIEIISAAASGLRVLDVLWDGKIFAMFESDIAARGIELFERTAEARPARAEDDHRKRAAKAQRAAGF